MIFEERLRPETTPQRVYTLCKLVNYNKFTKDQLKNFIQPEKLNTNQSNFNLVYNFALRGALIKEDHDGFIVLNIDEKYLENNNKFRKKLSEIIFSNENSMFYRYTSWYLEQNERIFKYTSSKEMQRHLVGEFINIREVDLLGWRFWASYLGIGFLHKGFIIPNTYTRIKDSIENDDTLTKNETMPFGDFIVWLQRKCLEFKQGIKGNNVSLGVSSGLRALHDEGLIKMNYISDAIDVWHLFRVDTHEIPENVTEIVIERW